MLVDEGAQRDAGVGDGHKTHLCFLARLTNKTHFNYFCVLKLIWGLIFLSATVSRISKVQVMHE